MARYQVRKKARYTQSKRTRASLALINRRIGRVMRAAPTPEKKIISYAVAAFNVPTAAWGFNSAILQPATFQQGTNQGQRIGSRITIKSIHYRVHVVGVPATITQSGAMFRMGLYRNHHAEGAYPVPLTVWNANTVASHRNPFVEGGAGVSLTSEHMGVVVATVSNAATVVGTGPVYCFDLKLFPKHVTIFSASSVPNVITDLLANDYGIYFLADNVGLSMQYQCTVKYIDS